MSKHREALILGIRMLMVFLIPFKSRRNNEDKLCDSKDGTGTSVISRDYSLATNHASNSFQTLVSCVITVKGCSHRVPKNDPVTTHGKHYQPFCQWNR